jgi:cell division protease FtsH
MGGRAAEELLFGADRITTGAQSDIEYATKIATRMVQDWGFSPKIGMVKVSHERALHDPDVSSEVRRIVAEAYVRALEILNANRASLDALTTELLERNTIEGDDVRRIVDQHKAA